MGGDGVGVYVGWAIRLAGRQGMLRLTAAIACVPVPTMEPACTPPCKSPPTNTLHSNIP